MIRIMGIDYGDARVGVAISDPLGICAQGLETICNTSDEALFNSLSKLIEKYSPDKIVVGLPKNMNNTLGARADKTMEFTAALGKIYKGEIVLSDERLTTVIAHRTMNDTNLRGKKRKQTVDAIAAMLILQNYLDAHPSS